MEEKVSKRPVKFWTYAQKMADYILLFLFVDQTLIFLLSAQFIILHNHYKHSRIHSNTHQTWGKQSKAQVCVLGKAETNLWHSTQVITEQIKWRNVEESLGRYGTYGHLCYERICNNL